MNVFGNFEARKTVVIVVVVVLLIILLSVVFFSNQRILTKQSFAITKPSSVANNSVARFPLKGGARQVSSCNPTLSVDGAVSYSSIFDLYPSQSVIGGCGSNCTVAENSWYGCVVPFSSVIPQFVTGNNFNEVDASMRTFLPQVSQELANFYDSYGHLLFEAAYYAQSSGSPSQKIINMFNILHVTPKQVGQIARIITSFVNANPKYNLNGKTVSQVLYGPTSTQPMPNPLSSAQVSSNSLTPAPSIPLSQPTQVQSSNLFVGAIPYYPYDLQLNERNYVMACAFDSMLAAIGTNQPYAITYNSVNYTSIGDYFTALSNDGHPIQVSIYTRVAGFLPLLWRTCGSLVTQSDQPNAWAPGSFADVPFDLFVDTQIPCAEYGDTGANRNLLYPAMHSEIHFSVQAVPNLSTQDPRYDEKNLSFTVSFTSGCFLGGITGFSPDPFHNRIPPWVGSRQIMSDFTTSQILQFAYLAEAYAYAFNTASSIDKLPIGGYGSIGICDDCVGVLQQCVLGYDTLWPQTLDKSLLTNTLSTLIPSLSSNALYLKPYLQQIQQAVGVTPSDDTGVLSTTPARLLATSPYLWSETGYQAPFASTFNTNQAMAKLVSSSEPSNSFVGTPPTTCASTIELPSLFNAPIVTDCVSSIVLPYATNLNYNN